MGKGDLKWSKLGKKKKKDEKTEKYSTNERARYKLTRPNKQRGISNLSEREFRIMIVKML